MILNAYAVLDAFVTLLRLLLAAVMLVTAFRGWSRQAKTAEQFEQRQYLLAILASVLLLLNVVAWPLFYLLLESCIPQWSGVMCIYGVTQIGSHSDGIAGNLPTMVRTLEITKPLLVFLSGAWLALHLANRRTATAPLSPRINKVLLTFAFLACVDATIEIGYLAIPKAEEALDSGCCTLKFDDSTGADSFLPEWSRTEAGCSQIVQVYYGLNGLLSLGLVFAIRAARRRFNLAMVLFLTFCSVPASFAFLVEIAAPTILHLPYHHCPYDLVPHAPDSVVAIALYFLGLFAVGWACLTEWLGDSPETRPFLHSQVTGLLSIGLFGYLGSTLMMAVEMALA
jgi:hypothetical protein